MKVMSKETMITCLKDYAKIQKLLVHNPNVPIEEIFKYYMQSIGSPEKATEEYYHLTRDVYVIYNVLKNYSIIEDFLLNQNNYLNNNDLYEMSNNYCIIDLPINTSNKKIAQHIRNTFNHNDAITFDRFRISEDAKQIEIELKDTRTKTEKNQNLPEKHLQLIFTIDDLVKINNIIDSKRENQLYLHFDIPDDFNIFADNIDEEIDRIQFVHPYHNGKLSREVINKFNELGNFKELKTEQDFKERKEELNNYSNILGETITYPLNSYQKEELKLLLNDYKDKYGQFANMFVHFILNYYLEKITPIPAYKNKDINDQLLLCGGFYHNPQTNYNEINSYISNTITNRLSNHNNIDSDIKNYIDKKSLTYKMRFYNNLLDKNFNPSLPVILYIDSVITHLCTSDEITIDGKTYNREKIRNSFVHLRWYITHDNKIVMFDGDPRNRNDCNLEFVGKIDIDAFERWTDNYRVENINKTEKKDSNHKSILHKIKK